MSIANVITFIYQLIDPRTGEIRYIGKTIDAKKRYWSHTNKMNNTHCSRWIAGLLATDLKPEMRIVAEVQPGENWEPVEKAWIEWGRVSGWPLTNITEGGYGSTGNTGRKMSIEAKQKMSAAKRNNPEFIRKLVARNKSLLGKQVSPKRHAKMFGRVQSAEERQKKSAATKGVKFNAERRAHMSEAAKRRWAKQRAKNDDMDT